MDAASSSSSSPSDSSSTPSPSQAQTSITEDLLLPTDELESSSPLQLPSPISPLPVVEDSEFPALLFYPPSNDGTETDDFGDTALGVDEPPLQNSNHQQSELRNRGGEEIMDLARRMEDIRRELNALQIDVNITTGSSLPRDTALPLSRLEDRLRVLCAAVAEVEELRPGLCHGERNEDCTPAAEIIIAQLRNQVAELRLQIFPDGDLNSMVEDML